MKTDIVENIGKHAFEIAGLGKAPFRFVGLTTNTITHPDGSTQPGGSCDYCGTGIVNECQILSADGKRSKVGCDCIAKVDDAGLLKAYRTSPEFRRKAALARRAKDARVSEELGALVKANEALWASQPHPYGFTDHATGKPLTRLDQIRWHINRCGATGRASFLKFLKRELANPYDTR